MDKSSRQSYEQNVGAWMAVEAIVRQLEKEKTAHAVAKQRSESGSDKLTNKGVIDLDGEIENEVFAENGFSDLSDPEDFDDEHIQREEPNDDLNLTKPTRLNKSSTDSGNVADEDVAAKSDDLPKLKFVETASVISIDIGGEGETILENDATIEVILSNKSSPSTSSYETVANDFGDMVEQYPETGIHHSVIITNASIDIVNIQADNDVQMMASGESVALDNDMTPVQEEIASLETLQEPKSACVSPASSGGGVYSVSFILLFIL